MTIGTDLFVEARQTQLGDSEGVTWPIASMIIAYNAAKKMLIQMRPDASSTIETISLRKGSRQFIPSNGMRLLTVVRNIVSEDEEAGPVIGRAIRQVRRSDLDSMAPDWHLITGSVVHEYCFDPLSPKHFYVYPSPANNDSILVEIEYSAMFPDMTQATVDDELPFDPVYDQPLIELMLYKLFSGDNEQGQQGGIHLRTAMDMLGVKSQYDSAIDPAKREK